MRNPDGFMINGKAYPAKSIRLEMAMSDHINTLAARIAELEAENARLRDRDIEVTRHGSKHSRARIAELTAAAQAVVNDPKVKFKEWAAFEELATLLEGE